MNKRFYLKKVPLKSSVLTKNLNYVYYLRMTLVSYQSKTIIVTPLEFVKSYKVSDFSLVNERK